tara:strand:+ start:413 stop:1540 length:1128 start_codon:yes stop_codon:yes gene_type:complete
MQHTLENTHGSLTQLMQKVQDQSARKADFLTPTNDLQKVTDPETSRPALVIEAKGGEPTRHLDVNSVAFQQLAAHCDIETRTARRLQDHYPNEFDTLINAHFQKEPKRKMLRTFLDPDETNGTARALLSDRFKTYDNNDMLQTVLPPIMENDSQLQVVQANISDSKLYMRFKSLVHTGAGANVKDIMANGVGFSNSETGQGSVTAYQLFWTLACLNGMQTENKTRSSHITSARDSDDWGLLSGEAQEADNRALNLKLRDLVSAYSSREMFDQVLEKMKAAAADVIEGEFSVADTVDNLGTVMRLTKKETSNVLDGLMKTIGQAGYEQDRPLSRATLINAMTAVGNVSDIDATDDWQRRGGQLLNMGQRDWHRIAA